MLARKRSEEAGPCARSLAASCRRPARRPEAVPGPASAACRSRAIASGHGRGSSPASGCCWCRPMISRTSSIRSMLRGRGTREAASSRNDLVAGQRQFEVFEDRQTVRTQWASEISGRFRPGRFPARRAPADSICRQTTPFPSPGRVLPVMTSIMVVLPGAVRPDDAAQLARLNCSVSSFSALKPSKLTVSLRDRVSCRERSFSRWLRLSRLESGSGSGFLCFRSARCRTRRPIIPRGRNSVTSTNNAPSA